MAEIVDFRYIINGNTLELIPLSDGAVTTLEDNSTYTIRISSLSALHDSNQTVSNLKVTVTTKVTPAYCTLNDLQFLQDMFDIPESQILYYIREASKYADYMEEGNSSSTSSSTEVSLPKREFVKIKVTLDCLLRAYIRRAAGTSTKGTLGVISYQDSENYSDSIGDLLDKLKAALTSWGEALKGYEREGRAAPRSARKAYKESDPTTFDAIVNDLTRTHPSNV